MLLVILIVNPFRILSAIMLSSIFSSVVFAGIAVASVTCPIKPYDARPGYQIACVYGDANGVDENQLVRDIDVVGPMFAATLDFECVRQEPKYGSHLHHFGYG
jgi:hypothetical protein